MSDKMQGGIKAGSTSVSVSVVIRKTADNTEKTGLVAAGFTSAYYWRQGGTPTTITALSDLASITSAYSAGGVKEADATHAPGAYRLDVDDAAFATGADWVQISVVVPSCYVFHERFALTTNVVQTGDSYARLGAPAGASIAADLAEIEGETDTLITGVNVTSINSIACTSVTTVNANQGTTQPLNFTGTGASALVQADTRDFLGQAVVLDANNLPQVDIQDIKGTASFGQAGYVGIDWGHVFSPTTAVVLANSTIGTVTTYTGNTPQTGDAFARLGAPAGASIAADLAEIEAETDGIASIPTTPLLAANVPANFASLGITAAGKISEVVLVDTLTTYTGNTPQTGDLYGRYTTAMTESYAAKGSTFTMEQFACLMTAWLTNLSISGTTYTATKLDGVTAAATGTLDSATTPTKNLRAT